MNNKQANYEQSQPDRRAQVSNFQFKNKYLQLKLWTK